jgi:hypothetical protein
VHGFALAQDFVDTSQRLDLRAQVVRLMGKGADAFLGLNALIDVAENQREVGGSG